MKLGGLHREANGIYESCVHARQIRPANRTCILNSWWPQHWNSQVDNRIDYSNTYFQYGAPALRLLQGRELIKRCWCLVRTELLFSVHAEENTPKEIEINIIFLSLGVIRNIVSLVIGREVWNLMRRRWLQSPSQTRKNSLALLQYLLHCFSRFACHRQLQGNVYFRSYSSSLGSFLPLKFLSKTRGRRRNPNNWHRN